LVSADSVISVMSLLLSIASTALLLYYHSVPY